MAITSLFTAGLSDEVVLDTPFLNYQSGGSGTASTIQTNPNQDVVCSYVIVQTSGSVVYRNSDGELQYIPTAPLGFLPISATEVVSAGTVRGTPRTTTGVVTTWMAGIKY